MTLRYVDSFDLKSVFGERYLNVQTGDYNGGGAGSSSSYSSTTQFTSGFSLALTSQSHSSFAYPGAQQQLQVNVDSSGVGWSSVVLGWRHRVDTATVANPELEIAFCDNAGSMTGFVDARLNSSGYWVITRNGTTLVTATAGQVSFGTWYYMELKVVVSATVGTVELRRNGTVIASGSNLNTGSSNIRGFYYLKSAASGDTLGAYTSFYDDVYFLDTGGAANNDFLGEQRVIGLSPTGAGSHTVFTRGGTDSGANWDQTNEVPPNGDTDYVQSSTAGDIDSYAMADLPAGITVIHGMQTVLEAKKDNTGTRVVAGFVRSSTTDSPGTGQSVTGSYVNYLEVRENDPATSAAWTATAVNAIEAGAKVTT